MVLRRSPFLIILLLFTSSVSLRALAQEPPRFAPPRPVFDGGSDFDDPNDDDLDLDSPNRPPPLPPATQFAPPPPPVTDFQPASGGQHPKDTGKIHFKIVEGDFYEKGKHRGRAPIRPDKNSAQDNRGLPDFGQDPQFQ